MILNVNEIGSALEWLANAYPQIAEVVRLPEATHEGQISTAIVIGKRPLCPAAGVLITGGVHAREFGGPDICVYLAEDICRAYTAGGSLSYGKRTFDAATIRHMVERMGIVIFPCVNPDGVRYAHANPNLSWRKNRNPTSSSPNAPNTIGVDICRNFDFLWDYKTAFAPAAMWPGLASDLPGSNQFHGPKPFSEPETRNVRWLVETYEISHYLDLHSHSGFVLYGWGDDDNQWIQPWQNFKGSAWNGKRGTIGGSYAEYMPLWDQWRMRGIAKAIGTAIEAVRGTLYGVHQSFRMPAFGAASYATSGVSYDWAYSRHHVNSRLRKVSGFGIEFNTLNRFTITYQELQDMAPDVTAGLVQLCKEATPGWLSHFIRCTLGLRWPFW